MSELNLPHLYPVRFAKRVLHNEKGIARVLVEFEEIPSLGMLIEASAQSTAAFSDGSQSRGYLVGMKSVKLLNKAKKSSCVVKVTQKHQLDSMSLVGFEVFEDETLLCRGDLTIVLS